MPRNPTTLLAIALAFPLAAQSASLTPFGQGCGSPPVQMSTQGLPQLGSQVTFVYTGPNLHQVQGHTLVVVARPILMLGFSNQQANGTPLPFALPTALTGGIPGCSLLVSPDALVTLPAANLPWSPFETWYHLPVPNHPGFLGTTLYAQWLALQTQSPVLLPVPPSAQMWTSSAVQVVVGV